MGPSSYNNCVFSPWAGFDKDLHGATGAGSRLFAHIRRDLSRYEDGERLGYPAGSCCCCLGHPAGSCCLLLLVILFHDYYWSSIRATNPICSFHLILPGSSSSHGLWPLKVAHYARTNLDHLRHTAVHGTGSTFCA